MSESNQDFIIQFLIIIALILAIFKMLKDKRAYFGLRRFDRENRPKSYWLSMTILIVVTIGLIEGLLRKLI